jgi:hypothetical protein
MLEKEKLSVFLSDMTGLRGPASHPNRVLAARRATRFSLLPRSLNVQF